MDPAPLRDASWFDREAYPFPPQHLEFPAGRLHYLDEGPREAPAVLLVHGTPSWSWEWRHLVPRLAGRFRCVAPDLLGFGFSARPAPTERFSYRLAEHTASLRALVDHLGIGRFSLIAHDFGGPVALPLALDEPGRVERLVLLNTWLWSFRVDPTWERQRRLLASPLMRWAYRRLNLSARVIVKQAWGRRAPLDAREHRHYTGMFPDAASRAGTVGFLRALVEEGDRLDQLWARRAALAPIPALVLWGMADRFIPPLHLQRWREALPTARVVELADVGHFPQVEAADEVNREIAAFLDG